MKTSIDRDTAWDALPEIRHHQPELSAKITAKRPRPAVTFLVLLFSQSCQSIAGDFRF
jgi:hypothetical protein